MSRRPTFVKQRVKQRGVALLTAMLIVALAVILATQIGFDSALEQRRSATVLTMDQAFQVALGAEIWAAGYLRDDDNAEQDHLAETWATPMPPIPIDGGQIEGRIEDLQGRFNINNLVEYNGGQFIKNPEAMNQFTTLLQLIGLEQDWTGVIVDWLDSDVEAEFPQGAEDNVYTAQTPPYRAANGPVSSTSELLALPNFGLARYRKLEPFITALPIGTSINVCTASGIVLDSFTPGSTQYSLISAEEFTNNRSSECFPRKSVIANQLRAEQQQYFNQTSQETTEYFQLSSVVTIGSTQFSLYSLLRRDSQQGGRRVRPVLRSFGTY